DGIRDPLVTGVQTCALPIFRSPPPEFVQHVPRRLHEADMGGSRLEPVAVYRPPFFARYATRRPRRSAAMYPVAVSRSIWYARVEIGRASWKGKRVERGGAVW